MKKMNTGVKRPLFYTTFISPLGPIYITFTQKGVSKIALGIDSEKAFVKSLEKVYQREVIHNDRRLTTLKKQIGFYFTFPLVHEGYSPKSINFRVRNFSFRFSIDLLEGTPFERKVWHQIKKIPYGKLLSYKDLAIKIGMPKASRAIGMACKKNPLPILIPCHRVVGKDGSLKGYSSGIEIKKRLLEIEGVRDIKL